jgi:hypothetical protein
MKNERASNSNLVIFTFILFFISFFIYNAIFFNLFGLNHNKKLNLNKNNDHENVIFDGINSNFTLLNEKCKHKLDLFFINDYFYKTSY